MRDLKRTLLFLIGCIGTRFFIAYLAKIISKKYLPIMGYLALIPAFGFILIYTFKLRKTGTEVSGEKIWWDDLRPIHGILYLLFAYSAIHKSKEAWKILLFDVIFGLLAYINHYYIRSLF